MYRRNKNRPKKIPLVVKEVVLPKKEIPETSQSCRRKDFGIIKADVDNFIGNSVNVKLGSHEVKPVNTLLILKKKPLENYFEGTKQVKETKKKIKSQKTKFLKEPDVFVSQAKSDESETSKIVYQENPSRKVDKVIQECLTREEKIQRKKVLIRLQNYENLREHRERKNHLKQRMEERKYIQQQENLYNTWMGLLKKRNHPKELSVKDDNHLKHVCQKSSCSCNRVSLSIASRAKNQRQEKVEKEEKKPEERETEPGCYQSISDELNKDFLKKLGFVDVDDSND